MISLFEWVFSIYGMPRVRKELICAIFKFGSILTRLVFDIVLENFSLFYPHVFLHIIFNSNGKINKFRIYQVVSINASLWLWLMVINYSPWRQQQGRGPCPCRWPRPSRSGRGSPQPSRDRDPAPSRELSRTWGRYGPREAWNGQSDRFCLLGTSIMQQKFMYCEYVHGVQRNSRKTSPNKAYCIRYK